MLRTVVLLACLSTLGAGESHLSEAQLSQLQKIIRGDVGKREVELVLAHFNENTTWSDPYASIRTIYCKGSQVPGCVPLNNVGREGHTYLNHIVSNYDNLADWTIFSQAGPPSNGYLGHRLGGGHMQAGVDFNDYLLRDKARDSFFVFTGALHIPSLHHVIRSSYLVPPTTPEDQAMARAQCPSTSSASDQWERLDLPKWFDSMMSKKCGIKKGGLQAHLQQYWQGHVNPDMPEGGMVFFTQGARFAVSRDQIHQRTREEYKDLLNLVSESVDPCANYMNEWLWFYIMGKPQQAPCAVRGVDLEAPSVASIRGLSGTSGTSGDEEDEEAAEEEAAEEEAAEEEAAEEEEEADTDNTTDSGDDKTVSTAAPAGFPTQAAMWIMAAALASRW